MNTIENSICEAISVLVNRAVAQASYDKTIQGTVVRCEDATIGKYTVRYQDSLFQAYSSNSDVTYRDGAIVYVLVPSNDMSKQKTIIGTTEKLGINYIAVAEGDQAYQYVGNNVITGATAADPFLNDKGEFMLSSYQKNDAGDNRHVYTLYQAELQDGQIVEKINKLNVDLSNLQSYMAESATLICGAYVRTSLENKQQQKGDYGILFRLAFDDNATGQVVIRPYIINVDKMIGNPYKFTSAVRQYGIFDIDGANFRYVESISIFEYDFPYSKEESQIRNPQDYDIFFSNFSLMCANRLTDEQIATYALLLHTPRGAIFSGNEVSTDTRSIEAEVRVKGKTVREQSLPFYWFVEDAGVASDSIYYCQYGGRGWRCLNQSNLIRDQVPEVVDQDGNVLQEYQAPVYEWVPGSSSFVLKKGDVLAETTKIKCAVVYDNTVITKQITFKNLSGIKIEIVSDSGVQFYYDTGTPTLTCLIDGAENITVNADGTRANKNYIYTWSAINNTGDFTLLVKQEDLEANQLANDNYNKKIVEINTLQNQINNQTVLKASGNAALDQLKIELADLNAAARATVISTVDARVDLNKIDKLNVGCITKYMIFKCTVTDAVTGKYIGTASLNITNSLNKVDGYTLVINNGVQSFKYSESGVSPTSSTLINPFVIPELSFTIYDDLGREIDSTAAAQGKITWQVPCVNTMLSSANGQMLEQNDQGYVLIENQPNLVYDIKGLYNVSYKRNNIKLSVNYKGLVLTTSTDFTFIKQGDPGTNGTDFVFRIEPNVRSGEIPYYPTIFVNGTTVLGFNWNQIGNTSGGAWFKACLYENNERIWTSGDGTNLVRTTWSILANHYFTGAQDVSMLRITSQDRTTGVASFAFNTSYSPEGNRAPANILKCEGVYNGVTYYATLPVCICLVYNTNYRAWLKEYTGFNYAVYTTDGRRPSYDNSEPFTVVVTERFNGYDEDVTKTKVDGHIVTYNWSLLGSIANMSSFTPVWNDSATILQKIKDLDNNYQYSVKPVDDYRSECVTNAVRCEVLKDGIVVARLFMPVHTMLNRYGNARLNGWDGNSITINNDEGFILAPQVGAGKKDSYNRFTGVLMGEAKAIDSGASITQIGLLGYSEGKQSIFLDAETGDATFGVAGQGQIELRPGPNRTSKIAKWHINEKTLSSEDNNITIHSDGKIYSNGKSSLTDIHDGFYLGADGISLGIGDGVFSVDNEGKLTSVSGTIGGWKINTDQLYNNSIHIKSKGSILGGGSEDDPRWIIRDNGSAQFYNIKITGTPDMPGYQSTLSWGDNKFNVFQDGSIAAPAGHIGEFVIDSGLRNANSTFSVTPNGGINAANGTFKVGIDGAMTSTSGSIAGWGINSEQLSAGGTILKKDGTITCNNLVAKTKGSIAGWTINSNKLTSESKTTTLYASGKIECDDFHSKSGEIGGWTIDKNGLVSGSTHIYPNGLSVNGLICNPNNIQLPSEEWDELTLAEVIHQVKDILKRINGPYGDGKHWVHVDFASGSGHLNPDGTVQVTVADQYAEFTL